MDKENIGIYKITSPTGRVYVGQSKNIKRRIKHYRGASCKNQKILYASIQKHGWESHILEVIEVCDIDALNDRERYWQDFYNVLKGGLNCVLVNTKTKKKVVKPFSDSHKGKISKALKGKIVSMETREKLRNANLGKKASDEAKSKMSKTRLGRKRNPDLPPKKGIKGKDHPLFGKKLKPETIKKLCGRSGAKNSMYRPILNLETGIFYDTLQEAADSVPTTKDWMRGSLTGNLKRKSNFTR